MIARTGGRLDGQLRACPYFREIAELFVIAPACSWRLFAAGTDAARWNRAKRWMIRGRHAATLLPVGCDPASLRWPAGTVIADISGQPGVLMERLALALIRSGVTNALLIDLANPARTAHVKPTPQECAA